MSPTIAGIIGISVMVDSFRGSVNTWLQQTLQARFDARFPHRVTLHRALHEESAFGIHRVSRFERTED